MWSLLASRRAGRLSVLWEFDLGESAIATPIVSGDAVFVRSEDHLWELGEN
jgi:hypothetical protein